MGLKKEISGDKSSTLSQYELEPNQLHLFMYVLTKSLMKIFQKRKWCANDVKI